MTAPTADRWCCWAVQVAARVLPAEHRHRYALEFIAELYGMPRRQQIQHSLRVLSCAGGLRAALADVGVAPTQESAMRPTIRSWLLCHLGRHRWVQHRNPEVGGKDAVFQLCLRCGRERQGHEVPPPGAIVGG